MASATADQCGAEDFRASVAAEPQRHRGGEAADEVPLARRPHVGYGVASGTVATASEGPDCRSRRTGFGDPTLTTEPRLRQFDAPLV